MIAKKGYKCDLCSELIPAGMDYFRYVGKPWEACDNIGFFTLRYHLACEAWIQDAMRDGEDWSNEDLRDEYREQHQAKPKGEPV